MIRVLAHALVGTFAVVVGIAQPWTWRGFVCLALGAANIGLALTVRR